MCMKRSLDVPAVDHCVVLTTIRLNAYGFNNKPNVLAWIADNYVCKAVVG